MIKNIILTVVIMLLAIAGYILLRRPLPPPPPPDARHHGPPIPGERLRTREGVVLGYRHNSHLDVNAMQLRTAEEGVIGVDFRPHTARTVMQLGAIGDSVRISYNSNPNDEYIVYQLHRIENLRTGGQADLDALPPPPDVPANYMAESFTVQAPQILTDPYGGLDAIQYGRLLFHFKPGLVDEIAGLIKTAKTITLNAVQRSEDFGFVNINQDKVYIVVSVTIDHKTFIVR